MCVGLPGRITATTDVAGFLVGTADFEGVSREVWLAYLPDAQAGDYILVNGGFAVRIIDQAEAKETLALLRSVPGAVSSPAVASSSIEGGCLSRADRSGSIRPAGDPHGATTEWAACPRT
jgi:hydrogenase expression/formation protein HypC